MNYLESDLNILIENYTSARIGPVNWTCELNLKIKMPILFGRQ